MSPVSKGSPETFDSPMNTTVAHDDVCGAKAGAQLRGHWK